MRRGRGKAQRQGRTNSCRSISPWRSAPPPRASTDLEAGPEEAHRAAPSPSPPGCPLPLLPITPSAAPPSCLRPAPTGTRLTSRELPLSPLPLLLGTNMAEAARTCPCPTYTTAPAIFRACVLARVRREGRWLMVDMWSG